MVDQEIGLLIGAGASFELGMPLVSHLTGEFKGYFTSAHLRQLNARWRQQGGGCDDSVIELIIDLLNRHDLHYENILGCLQTMARRHDQHPLNNTGICTRAWSSWSTYYFTIANQESC